MSLIDKIIATIAPHDCLGCGLQGLLLCRECSQKLQSVTDRCYRCLTPSPLSQTCLSCQKTSNLSRVYPAVIYKGLAKDLVWKLKFGGGQMAAQQMATLMKNILNYEKNTIIVPVPTATSRARSRGYDQANLLAIELSRITGMRRVACLCRLGQAHQVGANGEQRRQQLAEAYFVKKNPLVKNSRILLVDDVLTTGSTLEAAASVLKRAGAHQIDAVIFAQA